MKRQGITEHNITVHLVWIDTFAAVKLRMGESQVCKFVFTFGSVCALIVQDCLCLNAQCTYLFGQCSFTRVRVWSRYAVTHPIFAFHSTVGQGNTWPSLAGQGFISRVSGV